MFIVMRSDIDGSTFFGPCAPTIAGAAEGWYLAECRNNHWSNQDEGFAGADHEAACDAYMELQRLPVGSVLEINDLYCELVVLKISKDELGKPL